MEPQVWKVAEATETTVLLVEDDDKLSTALGKFLETYSCRTVRAKNGVEGLRAIMYSDFDIIVCDMVMPTFPGDMFYRAVERVKPALCKRFLFMTGHRADPRWDTFIRQVGGLMLWKPFQMHELLTAMRGVLKKTGQLDAGHLQPGAVRSSRTAPAGSKPPAGGRSPAKSP